MKYYIVWNTKSANKHRALVKAASRGKAKYAYCKKFNVKDYIYIAANICKPEELNLFRKAEVTRVV